MILCLNTGFTIQAMGGRKLILFHICTIVFILVIVTLVPCCIQTFYSGGAILTDAGNVISMSLSGDLTTHIIPRTPLPPIHQLPIGDTNCTGGGVFAGLFPFGNTLKVTGIYVSDPNNQLGQGFIDTSLPANANATNQPVATNIGKVLFELRQAGVRQTSASNISDGNIFSFLHGVRRGFGLNPPSVSTELSISNRLIDALGDTQ